MAAGAKLAVSETCQTDPLVTLAFGSASTTGYNFVAGTDDDDYIQSITLQAADCNAPIIEVTTRRTGGTPDPIVRMNGPYVAGAAQYQWNCRAFGSTKSQHVPATCRAAAGGGS